VCEFVSLFLKKTFYRLSGVVEGCSDRHYAYYYEGRGRGFWKVYCSEGSQRVPAPATGKGKAMGSGMFEVCSRVKNLSICARFCALKAAL
jgi:hypothetical protein